MLRFVFGLCAGLLLAGCAAGGGGYSTPGAGFGYAANEAVPGQLRNTTRPGRQAAAPKRGKKLKIPKTVAHTAAGIAGKPVAKTAPKTALRDDRLDPSQYLEIRTRSGKALKGTSRGTRTAHADPTSRGRHGRAAGRARGKGRYGAVRLDAVKARDLINAYRRKHGLKPLVLNARLTRAAMVHSRDLARFDRISHHGSDGSDPWDRVRRSGYRARLAAENVGTGQASLQEVFKGWQNSPGHNANLLLKDATQMGIALVYDPRTEYRTFWTLVLGAPL